MSHQLELDLIYFIHQFRTPFLDEVFKFLNFFDRQEFFFVLIPFFWLIKGWKSGLRLFYLLLLSNFFNVVLKDFFQSPRPFHLDPTFGIVQVSGWGFPSGAAQTTVLLSGLLIDYWKNSWKWVICGVYILVISFSRIYLGVHFPSDILAGWLVGGTLVSIYLNSRTRLDQLIDNLQPKLLLLISQIIPILFIVMQPVLPVIQICSVARGLGFGSFIIYSYQLLLPPPVKLRDYIRRVIVGVVGTFICYQLTLPIATTFYYFSLQFLLLGVWVSLGSYLVCRQFFNDHHSIPKVLNV